MKPPHDLFELTRVAIEDLLEWLDEDAFARQGRLRRRCVAALRSAHRRLEARLA